MRRLILRVSLAVLVVSALPTMQLMADYLARSGAAILAREPQLKPAGLGDGALPGLQFADPAEQLVVMEPPEPSNRGGAQLEHALVIPPGRGGFQPDLALTYDSAGGNGWLGSGWDLNVGEVSIDTRWGVPRYDMEYESETYLLDGDVLSPTAVRAEPQDRITDRSDFSRRTETEYELIIRHGDSPKTYWWEVRDKMGGVRWYGGYPDAGGPEVGVAAASYPSLEQDPSAILFDEYGNAYRWALTAQRDVGVNMIRYFYEKADGQRVGAEHATLGQQLYLKRILYTAAAEKSGQAEDPAYEVLFLRDGDMSSMPTPRKDVIVDARGGFLEVTSDLLRRIEIRTGAPKNAAERAYNVLSRRYDLVYQEGAYAKTLLSQVKQIGSDGAVYGTHTFDYYDDVRTPSGYDGFGPEVHLKTGPDPLQGNVLYPVPLSALGASETNAGDVHAYIGFNTSNPTKNGSFGGAFTINGGATEALVEMMDINGDGLLDKVFREKRGGKIFYRLNTTGPGRSLTYGEKHEVGGQLNNLSTEFNIGLAVGFEANLAAIIQFTAAGDVTVGEQYFTDVNSDGLADFVSAGTVYFNRLDDNGNPVFEPSSSMTSVPITTGSAILSPIQAIQDLEDQRRDQSPLQDTVRRWVAPFDGMISIEAPVTLEPPIAPGNAEYPGDGVRVAIQRNADELWARTLTSPGSVTPVGLGPITVQKGDRLYFRVQAIDDGARDQVRWDPTIAYMGMPPADANSLSQKAYRGAGDFTLAGRPHLVGLMPLRGRVRFEGTLFKTGVTTDDVNVLVLKNGEPVFQQLIGAATVSPGGIPLTGDFLVAAPTETTGDMVEVRLAVDSPIDVTAVRLDHRLYYIEADPVDGQSIPYFDPNGAPTLALQIPADTDIYPQNTLVAPREPWVSDRKGEVTAHASLDVGPNSGGGDVFFTVKSEAGLVAKKRIAVPDSAEPQSPAEDLTFEATSGTRYWFDFSIRNPGLSDKASGQRVEIEGGETATAEDVDVALMSSTGRMAYLAATGRLDQVIAAALSGEGPSPDISIAVDDTGQHIVVGANDLRGLGLDPVSISGYSYSDDGGETWVDGGPLPITAPTSSVEGPLLPMVFGSPQVRYLGGSTFVYFSLMVKDFSDTHAAVTLSFHRSTDHGHTWTGPYEVPAATNPHGLLTDEGAPRDAADRPFIDVDPDTGRVMVSWINFTPVSPGMEISTTTTDTITDEAPVWSDQVVVTATGVGQSTMAPRFAGGGSPDAYLAWQGDESGTSVRFALSTDNGASWSPSTIVASELFFEQTSSSAWVQGFPSLAVDSSSWGGSQGNIYLAYVVRSAGDTADIAFQRSTDGGLTFTPPVLLNSGPGGDRTQWVPWVTVDDDTGRVHVSYYDQSAAEGGDLTDAAHLFSDDGGVTWSKPAQVNDRSFHAVLEDRAVGSGTLHQAVAQGGRLYAAWAGAREQASSSDGDGAFLFKQVSGGQASLRLGAVSITESDGDGAVDDGELLSLTLPLENFVTNPLNRASISEISATLVSPTAGVSVLDGESTYPDLSPGASAANSASYVLALGPEHAPGAPIELVLTAQSSEGSTTLMYTLTDSAPAPTGTPLTEQADIAGTVDAPAGGEATAGPESGLASESTAGATPAVEDAAETVEVPSVLNWAGRQGAFPISYRGWGYVGYNGDGDRASQPIHEADLELRPDQLPDRVAEPQGFDDPDYQNVSQGNVFPFIPTRVKIRGAGGEVIGVLPAWGGMKDSILGAAELVRTSRRGADSPSLGIPFGEPVQAIRRVGITAPSFTLGGGFGWATASFGVSPSFGLVEYMDLNGDGFPDIAAPGYVKYTGPRGGFVEDRPGLAVVNQDTSFGVAAGIGADGIKFSANSRGDQGTAQDASGGGSGARPGNSSQTGGSGSMTETGAGVGGVSIGFTAAFTNPNASNPDRSDDLDQIPDQDPTAPFELELADVNGDGLPDRVMATPQGVYVQFNLGYRFAGQSILWASGGFESNESYGGSVGGTLGFSTPNREWAGGLGLSESIDLSHYSWIDVDGDGVVDRLRKDTAAAGSPVMVAFGTNSGVEPEVVYGPMAAGTFELASAEIPVGQQIAAGLSRGVGAGFDFTIGIGPLCFITGQCYLIINPGVHFDHSISNTQIQLTDIDGDGYPDSVKSLANDEILVRFNNRGRSNLLSRVRNPLGGAIRLDYMRDGNTVSQPNSVWTLASVEVDDGRPGDGEDVRLSTYEYSGGRYDRLEREMLGYSAVIERQRAFAGDGDVSDDPVLRIVERHYLNHNVFDRGLQFLEVVKSPAGARVQETRSTWSLIDLCQNSFPDCTPGEADLAPNPTDPAGLRLLGMAVAPQLTRVEQRWFDASENVGQETWTTYDYDRLGNVVRQVDIGEPELPEDDLIVTLEYTTCSNASELSCSTTPPLGGAPPYWHPDVCPTWTSLPARMVATDGSGNVVRKRDGAPALCDNSAVTDLKEWFGPGADDFARTRLGFDAHGSYDTIWYPDPRGDQDDDPADLHDRSIADESERLRVDYTYDSNTHANIARTIDSHGLEAHATFDARTGRIDCRADENGQETRYTYDALGRISTITGPYEPSAAETEPCGPDGQPADTPTTVRFEYHADAAGYAYAIARHFDVRHPADTIDTVTFVDGIGRRTQTKQDGTVFRGADASPQDVMLVSPAVDYDSLGRTVRTRYPVTEPLGTIGLYNADTSGRETTFELDLLDREIRSVAPGARVTTTTYDFGEVDGSTKLFRTTVNDANGKPQAVWTDVHDYVMVVDDGQPRLRTRYDYDVQGQLIRVTDNGGNVTTHRYDLMGRLISTHTPDAGLVETRWDPASNKVAMITPNLRNAGQQIDYRYDIDRLIAIDYPDTTPDVAYTYGARGAPGNAAGRLIHVVDGARQQSFAYDRLGEVAAETTIMFLHNGPTEPFTTSFTRDVFGRLLTMTYPDGEVLTYQYDSGGLLSSLQGRRSWPTEQDVIVNDYLRRLEYDEFRYKRYQEFGNGVSTEYSFDPATRWLARQVSEAPERTVQDLNYEYDNVGNVLVMDNRLPSPDPNLKGGPSRQTYQYDPYYRLRSATGTAPETSNRQRDYTLAVTYDSIGNTQSKVQRDTTSQVTSSGVVRNPREENGTTYSFDPMTYNPTRAHQLASAGGLSYSFDDNGNLTRIADSRDRTQRTITWNAGNRAVQINDSSSSTDYRYDHLGLLGVQRDGLGQTAFVNDYYETVNQGWTWRQIWAGGDRIAQATERISTTGDLVKFQYYQHENLQGSTQVVTDVLGEVFERIEYFPNGEQWISENSTTSRTPYRFIGALRDEARSMYSLGQRWYEPREQVFYSPEPLLDREPDSVIADSSLLPAYTYAGSNPLAFYDDDGRASKGAQRFWAEFTAFKPPRQQELTRTQARLRAQAIAVDLEEAKRHSRLWQSLVKYAFSETAERRAAWSKKLEKKPLLTFELTYTGKKLGLSNIRSLRLNTIKVGLGTREGTVKSWDTQAETSSSGKGTGEALTLRKARGGTSVPRIGSQRARQVRQSR